MVMDKRRKRRGKEAEQSCFPHCYIVKMLLSLMAALLAVLVVLMTTSAAGVARVVIGGSLGRVAALDSLGSRMQKSGQTAVSL
jgi:hypothetical protein